MLKPNENNKVGKCIVSFPFDGHHIYVFDSPVCVPDCVGCTDGWIIKIDEHVSYRTYNDTLYDIRRAVLGAYGAFCGWKHQSLDECSFVDDWDNKIACHFVDSLHRAMLDAGYEQLPDGHYRKTRKKRKKQNEKKLSIQSS